MRIHHKLPVGQFTEIRGGYVFPTGDIHPGDVELGAKLQLICMFSVWELHQGKEKVGFYFESGFSLSNKSAYLLTFMESKRGKATTSTQVLRDDQSGLLIFDLAGAGSIAISTKVNKYMAEILEAQ